MLPVSATIAFNSFDLYVTFLLQHGHKPFLSFIGCICVPTGISSLRAHSYSFSQKFARITAMGVPIARPSTCTYHESLHVKYTLLTAIFKNFFVAALCISGEKSWLYSFCMEISFPSFSGTIGYKGSHQKILCFHPDLEQCFQLFLWHF